MMPLSFLRGDATHRRMKYGKRPKWTRRYAPPRSSEPQALRVRIAPCTDLEGLTFELSKMIARLQESGVHATGKVSLYMELRDAAGEPMALDDADNRPISVIDT